MDTTSDNKLSANQRHYAKLKAEPAAYAEFLRVRASYKKRRYQEDVLYRQKLLDKASNRYKQKITQETQNPANPPPPVGV